MYRCRRGRIIHCSVAVRISDDGNNWSGNGASRNAMRTTQLITSNTGNTAIQVVTNRFHLLALASLGSSKATALPVLSWRRAVEKASATAT